MTRPDEDLSGAEAAYTSLRTTLDRLTGTLAAQPSALPGWSRAELITHLARNADGNRRMAEGAIRNEPAHQYPGGAQQREEDIHAGRGRSAAEVTADLDQAQAALMATWVRMPDEAWDRPILGLDSTPPASRGPWSRWQEIEIHHLDLDLGYEPSDWPQRFVDLALASAVRGIPWRWIDPGQSAWVAWRLQPTDSEKYWYVVRSAGTVSVIEEATGEPTAMLRGPSYALLAWLLGRRQAHLVGLECTGDAELVEKLPEWAPFT